MTTVCDTGLTASTTDITNLREETWGVALPPGLTYDPNALNIGFFEFSAIVNRAASAFERGNPLTIVTHEAREELVNRAIEHKDDISIALDANNLTPFDLENAAYKQFDVATNTQGFEGRDSLIGGSKLLTLDDIRAAMALFCWFVGWC